ncbi:hypothetical protein [Gemmobacter serpentinus]|uniref:hypothetical protein n=1 Tax=Gemmobacter serpentinus TaxID=2652247 RepID=UPI00124CBDA7|nr:hypothetical protein [Gemmobacter serpentinus]
MAIFKMPEKKPQSKLQEFRDGMLGLAVLFVLGYVAWHWLTGDEELVAEQVLPVVSAEVAAQSEVEPVEVDAAARAEAEQLAATEAAQAAELAAEKAHEAKHGFHCLSGWDGSHRDFVAAVKAQLNDPDSFEHDETRTWPVREDGQNAILMMFRAKNGFGGVVRGKASGTFDNQSCAPTVQTIE